MVSVGSRHIELALVLLQREAELSESAVSEFSDILDDEQTLLLQVSTRPEDRIALALGIIPIDVAIQLACDFAEHALHSTSAQRKYDWQISEGKRNEEALITLRQCLTRQHADSEFLIEIWSRGILDSPILGPGLHQIARAASKRSDAAKYCVRAAKTAREYYAFRITDYPRHRRACRDAKRQELDWQMDHTRSVLAALSTA